MQQEFRETEIIVVCNDQNTSYAPHFLSDNHSSIKWCSEPSRGSAFARNAGLQYASGEWIQFLDVDDLLLPGKIKNQLQIKSNGAIVSPHIYRYVNGKSKSSKWIPEDFWCGLLNSGLGSTTSMLWNREALLKTGGWSLDYQSHQEYELLFRIAAAGFKIKCVDQKETIVRERKSGSITHLTKAVRAKEGVQLREMIWNFLVKKSNDTPERKNAFLQYTFRQLRGLFREDAEGADKLFQQYFTNISFRPEPNGIPLYALWLRSFGFKTTENNIHLYRILRDKFLPFLPKNN